MFFYYFCLVLFYFVFVSVFVCSLYVRAACPRAFSTCVRACVLSVIYTGMPACVLTTRVRALQYFVIYFLFQFYTCVCGAMNQCLDLDLALRARAVSVRFVLLCVLFLCCVLCVVCCVCLHF